MNYFNAVKYNLILNISYIAIYSRDLVVFIDSFNRNFINWHLYLLDKNVRKKE